VTQELSRGAIVATLAPVADGALPTDAAAPAGAAGIAPIRVPPIELPSIDPGPITIAPLAPIAELQVAPLSPLDRRN
jgi:hypothetical protein